MFKRIRRLSFFLLIACTLLISFQASPKQEVAAQSPADPDAVPFERLAALAGYDPQALDYPSVEALTLIDGRKITIMKAVDRRTGQTVGAAFDGERLVDARQEQQLALQAWRKAHGALAPDLVARIERSGADATYTVAVWYKAQVEALPKQAYAPPKRELSGSTAMPADTAPTSPAAQNNGQKIAAQPLSPDQVPPEVRARVVSSGSAPGNGAGLVEGASKPAEPEAPPADAAILAQVEAFQQQNLAHLKAQISPLRAGLLDEFASRQYTVQYASEIAPVIFLSGMSSADLANLAARPDIDAIYDASLPGGALLDVARPTQNADLLSSWGGYTGANIGVGIVEGERVSNLNPYLNLVQTRDTTRTIKSHPTGVAGIVGSFHSTIRGIASGARLFSGNGDDYTTIAATEAAMDWAAGLVPILNNSFWAAECGLVNTMQTIDRHMDYLTRYAYDLTVVASGNFNVVSCDGVNPGLYVSSPGKAYNALTVGNYQDQNTLGWTDDTMRPSSSYNTTGRWKPEVAASGSVINSTTTTNPWTGDIGSGTSFSSPMVAGLAANMLQADANLADKPEAITALIMATALHNIEGGSQLSRLDGTGGMVASAALTSVERGHYDDIPIDSTTTFPMTYTQFAYAGETVRFAIRWLSNPSADYTTDVLPVDLDLKAYRQNGTTMLNSSMNSLTNLEIVEFVAPASETYKFRIERFGSWSGTGTWLGIGWWRGVYRISPDTGYNDPKASPMGTHLAVKPSDWTPTNYWRVMGIRPNNSDHDLRLYSGSLAGDPSLRTQLNDSVLNGAAVDFIAVDGNHWPAANLEHYRISHYFDDGGYRVNWSNQGILLIENGWYGSYTVSSSQVVKVFDVWFSPSRSKKITIVPTGSNAADLGVALLRSDGGNSTTWQRRRSEAVKLSDVSTSPSSSEAVSYLYTGATGDYLGVVVFSDTDADWQFYIHLSEYASFLPFVKR